MDIDSEEDEISQLEILHSNSEDFKYYTPHCDEEIFVHKYKCPLCISEFNKPSNRYNHIKLHHKVELYYGKVQCLEEGCLFSCSYTTVLQKHLTNTHSINMNVFNLNFDNYNEFEKWKNEFETNEVCRFVKKSGSRVAPKGKNTYLYCSRSGSFSGKESTGSQTSASTKINAHCTALIKYFENSDTGHIKASVCSTHYGHNKDHRLLRLTKEQKVFIAEKLKSGMSRELLLDSLKSTFVDKLDRIHEITNRDLDNIRSEFNIPRRKETQKLRENSYCGLPIEIIIDNWLLDIDITADSPVLFYKDSNSTSKSGLSFTDKCLILMTKGQKDLFLKLCNNSILYISIFKISSLHKLYLIVIFVVDEFYETFPVCFMISTTCQMNSMKVLFNEILTTIGPIVVRALSTDNNEDVVDAWCAVMGPVNDLIISNQYVDMEWRENLAMVKDEARQGEIYDKLYEFIENFNGTKGGFERLIDELRNDSIVSTFALYLEENFLPNIHQWSTYYLKENYSLKEVVDFELTHNKISKLCSISSKYNKRVYCTVTNLFKLLVELQSSRNRKVVETLEELKNTHEKSLASKMTLNVFPVSNNRWKVPNNVTSTAMCEVELSKCYFDDCVLKCPHCEICIHSLCCSCDNFIDIKTCIHVHLVGNMLKIRQEDYERDDNMNEEAVSKNQTLTCSELPSNSNDNTFVGDNTSSIFKTKLDTEKILQEIKDRLISEGDEKQVDNMHKLLNNVKHQIFNVTKKKISPIKKKPASLSPNMKINKKNVTKTLRTLRIVKL